MARIGSDFTIWSIIVDEDIDVIASGLITVRDKCVVSIRRSSYDSRGATI